jgi:hypothetical protein
MKKTAIVCLTVLLAGSAVQAQSQPSQVPAIVGPNGTLYCPSGYHGPIQPVPGGAWVCVR